MCALAYRRAWQKFLTSQNSQNMNMGGRVGKNTLPWERGEGHIFHVLMIWAALLVPFKNNQHKAGVEKTDSFNWRD